MSAQPRYFHAADIRRRILSRFDDMPRHMADAIAMAVSVAASHAVSSQRHVSLLNMGATTSSVDRMVGTETLDHLPEATLQTLQETGQILVAKRRSKAMRRISPHLHDIQAALEEAGSDGAFLAEVLPDGTVRLYSMGQTHDLF